MPASASLFDSNLWVAMTFTGHEGHATAVAEYASATSQSPAVFCRSTEQSVLRLITTPTIMRKYGANAMTNAQALVTLASFQQPDTVEYREEPAGVKALWHRLADRATASPKVWMDAYLAAFAITASLTFTTFDQDFKAYVGQGLDLRLLATT